MEIGSQVTKNFPWKFRYILEIIFEILDLNRRQIFYRFRLSIGDKFRMENMLTNQSNPITNVDMSAEEKFSLI